MATNQITANGITTQTLTEIKDELVAGFQSIYGNDINLTPNSPDAQLINIVAQAKIDTLDLITQVFAGMDPDEAVGRVLDRRCAYNGIQRANGTFTQQIIDITVDRALTLNGVDSGLPPFVVEDSQGNKYELIDTANFSGASTVGHLFEAVEIGAVTSALNSITTISTITLGVVSVNNPSTAISTGIPEETDSALRTRRGRSITIPSKGYLDGLIGALLDIDGVSEADVFENKTGSTDVNGIPPYSIWAIVSGGDSIAIANAIYVKRSLCCGMKGSVSVDIIQTDKLITEIKFDRPIAQDLWIEFDVQPIYSTIDIVYLRQKLLENIKYAINQLADTARIVAEIKAIYPNASVSLEGVSDNGTDYFPLIQTTSVQHQFNIVEIKINGTV